MTELDPDLKALLQRAKGELSPGATDTARIAARLDGALHPATPIGPRNKPWLSSLLGVALGLAGGTGVGFYWGEHTATSNRATETAVPFTANVSTEPKANPPIAIAPPQPLDLQLAPIISLKAASTSSAVDRSSSRVAPRAQATEPAIPLPKVDAGNTVDEVEQVRRVRRALSQRDASLALLLLDELDRTLPKGRLMQERDAGKAIARCIQEPRKGSVEREAFERRHPASVHQARVTLACTK